jgi:hypothetical protein
MRRYEVFYGATNPLLSAAIVLGVLVVLLGGAVVWALGGYFDAKSSLDAKLSQATTLAKKQQQDKQPTRQFVGPDDWGRVSFSYPKTWSVYVARSGTGSDSTYEAYLHPAQVPPVAREGVYALRVVIVSDSYEHVVGGYSHDIEQGAIRSSIAKAGGSTGLRLDGMISNNKQGAAVIFKVRDKTLQLFTDGTDYRGDFDGIVLPSVAFNP